ncbi:thaumatin [Auriculariales sp. MPI-PUGE-AT-0066]|nr:thaumatin [Auriculariales sp. MPI-PUGE-AT-0066]
MPTMRLSRLAALMLALFGGNASRTLTVTNNCDATIWPVARQFRLNNKPNFTMTDWEAATGTSHTVEIPDEWSGDIVARTGCTVDPNTNERSCESGICGDGLTCNYGFNASGTTADVTNTKGIDYYSVLAYAYNLPVQNELQLTNSGGTTVACRSPCADESDTSLSCCSTANPCSESEMAYYSQLHQLCPSASPRQTPGENTGFRITFCPVPDINKGPSSTPTTSGSSSSPSASDPASTTPAIIGNSHAPVGAIAGGVVGGIVAVILLGLCTFLLWKRKRASRPVRSVSATGATNYYGSHDGGTVISPFKSHRSEAGVGYTGGISSPGASTRTTEVSSSPIWTTGGGVTGKRPAAAAATPVSRWPHNGDDASALAVDRETFDAHGRVAARSETDSGPNTIRGTDSEQHQTTPSAGTSTFENPHRDFPPPGYFSINHNQ